MIDKTYFFCSVGTYQSVPSKNVATFCQGIGIPARGLVSLPGKWDVFGNFPTVKLMEFRRHDKCSNLTPQNRRKLSNSPGRIGWKTKFPRWLIVFPWHKFPKIGQFPTGKVYLSLPPFPVCENGNRRFQSIGKKKTLTRILLRQINPWARSRDIQQNMFYAVSSKTSPRKFDIIV